MRVVSSEMGVEKENEDSEKSRDFEYAEGAVPCMLRSNEIGPLVVRLLYVESLNAADMVARVGD